MSLIKQLLDEAKSKKYVYVSIDDLLQSEEQNAMEAMKFFGVVKTLSYEKVEAKKPTVRASFSILLNDDQPSPRNLVDYDEVKNAIEQRTSSMWIEVSTKKL